MAVNKNIEEKKGYIDDKTKKISLDEITEDSKANFSGWYISTAITQTSGAIAEPYLPLFAKNILQASNSEIGLLAGIFSLINIVQIIWAQISLKIGRNTYFVFFGQLLTGLLFIPIAFLRVGTFFYLMILRILQGFVNSATIPTQATLKSDYIPETDRAKKITKFTYIGLIGSFTGSLVGGQLFDTLHASMDSESSYTIIFLFTAFLAIIGALTFYISVPSTTNMIMKQSISPVSYINRDLSTSKSKISFWTKLKGYIKKFKPFWIFSGFSMIFYFGVYIVSPFFIIIEIDHYQFTFLEASFLTSISIIIQVSVSMFLAKKNLLNTYGRKLYLLIGVSIILFFSILFLFPYYLQKVNYMDKNQIFTYCFIIWIILGAGWGLFNSTVAVFLLDIAHPQYRSLLIAFYNTLTGFSMFLGPIIGGITIDLTNEMITPFIIRVGFISVGLLYLYKSVKEPEISGIVLKPIKNVFTQFSRMSSSRGPELTITYGNEKMARKKHVGEHLKLKKK